MMDFLEVSSLTKSETQCTEAKIAEMWTEALERLNSINWRLR